MSKKFLWILGMVGFLLSEVSVEAMPRLWRSACGTVCHIDPCRNTMVLVTEKNKELVVIWKKRTRIYRDGKRIKELEFKEGEYICLHYRSPLFGKRWATKILLQNSKKGVLKKEVQTNSNETDE